MAGVSPVGWRTLLGVLPDSLKLNPREKRDNIMDSIAIVATLITCLPEQSNGLPACTCFWRMVYPHYRADVDWPIQFSCRFCRRFTINRPALAKIPLGILLEYVPLGSMVALERMAGTKSHCILRVNQLNCQAADIGLALSFRSGLDVRTGILPRRPEDIYCIYLASPRIVSRALCAFADSIRDKLSRGYPLGLERYKAQSYAAFVRAYPALGFLRI